MTYKGKVNIESLLKRLDIIKIELDTIRDNEQEHLDRIANEDLYSEEVEIQEDIVDCLDDAIAYFEKSLECLACASCY